MKKENQRVALTKRLLKESLLRLLETESLDSINVSLLCREAGINRATFYKHYTTPRDVLLDIEKDILGSVRKPEGARTPAAVREYLESICTCLYNNSSKLKILLRYNTDEDFAQLLSEFNNALWNMRSKVKGINELDASSVKLISTFLASGGYFLLRQWIMEDIDKSPAEVTDLIMAIISKE